MLRPPGYQDSSMDVADTVDLENHRCNEDRSTTRKCNNALSCNDNATTVLYFVQ